MSKAITFDWRRFKAWLALAGHDSLDSFTKPLPVGMLHARRVLRGESSPSAELVEALRQQIGAGWAFVTGQTDSLTDVYTQNNTAPERANAAGAHP